MEVPYGINDLLMMSVSDPRECTHNRNDYEYVCRDAGDQYRVVCVLVVDEDEDDSED